MNRLKVILLLFLLVILIFSGCVQKKIEENQVKLEEQIFITSETTNITEVKKNCSDCLECSVKFYCEHPETKIVKVLCENFVNTPSHVLIEFPNGSWYETTRDVFVVRETYPCNHTGYMQDEQWFLDAMVEKYC